MNPLDLAKQWVDQMSPDDKARIRECGAESWRDGIGHCRESWGWDRSDMRNCVAEIERLCAAEVTP